MLKPGTVRASKLWIAGVFGRLFLTVDPLARARRHQILGWVRSFLQDSGDFHTSPPDPSYTKAPSWVRHRPDDASNQNHAEFWSLARLTFPEAVAEVTGHTVPAPQMACFDYLYYTCATRIFEYEHDHSPSWRFVARHMHWEPVLQSLALGYVRQTMEVSPLQPIPPVSFIHARHSSS